MAGCWKGWLVGRERTRTYFNHQVHASFPTPIPPPQYVLERGFTPLSRDPVAAAGDDDQAADQGAAAAAT